MLDVARLQRLGPRELALHLRGLSGRESAEKVSEQLLRAIESEVISPLIYGTFLTAVDPAPLAVALHQQYSKYVRKVAIRQLGRDIRGPRWEAVWQDLGGIQGLLSLMSQMSMMEVKQCCQAIGRCKGRSSIDAGGRALQITELLKGLLPDFYPITKYKNTDQRPLHKHYARLVPACDSHFVENLLGQENHLLWAHLPKKQIVNHHTQAVRNLALATVTLEPSISVFVDDKIIDDYLPWLLQSAPPLPTSEPGISASMAFSMKVLEEIANQEKTCLSLNISDTLLVPLLRRLRNHNANPLLLQKTLDLAIQHYKKHPDEAKQQLGLDRVGVIIHAIRLWSIDPARFESRLITLLQLRCSTPDNQPRSLDKLFSLRSSQSAYEVFGAVKKHSRYTILCLLCQHSIGEGYDIDSEKGLSNVPIDEWPVSTFKILDSQQGISLLKRLIRIKPAGDFLQIDSCSTILAHASSPGTRYGDPILLLTWLQRGNPDHQEEAQEAVEGLKKRAFTSRDQDDRAFFAKSVILYAIASGSLNLYSTAVNWSKRFLKDFKAVKSLFSMDTCNTREGITLLCGIGECLEDCKPEEIRERIVECNGILMSLLDAAVKSLREPSFYASDWFGPLSLFQDVVQSRISHAGRLKRVLQLSEDILYHVLWDPTLKMLLEAEKLGIAIDHAPLNFNSPHGPLCFRSETNRQQQVKPALPSTHRFLDSLAESRDAIWRGLRPTLDPAVAALPPQFPRGLPIQCLTGVFKLATPDAFHRTPFLTARVQRIVMMKPELALQKVPSDDETKSAIGQSVDFYDFALAMYVMQCPEGRERNHALAIASSHAIHQLSGDRFSDEEAQLFWRRIFLRALPSELVPFTDIRKFGDFPVIPKDVDPSEPTEWDPEAPAPREIKARKLASNVLDCLLSAPATLNWHAKNRFIVLEPSTVAAAPESMWYQQRLDNYKRFPHLVREGMIAAALLVESSTFEGSLRLLASPFPSEEEIRYPALFLDQDFLQSSERRNAQPTKVLSYFTDLVPPSLLHTLTFSALAMVSKVPSDSSKLAERTRSAYHLLKLLSRGDKPQLASDLILQIIISRPEDSSWHRQLLGKTFLGILSATDAQNIISSFASSVFRELERHTNQSRLKEEERNTSHMLTKPMVKVTTMKLLAQILEDSEFVPPHYCVDILSEMFNKASHIDIRCAVVQSLMSRFIDTGQVLSDRLTSKLMSALVATVPVLGSLNEHKPIEESQWKEVENLGSLPEVYEPSSRDLAPILSLICNALANSLISSEEHRRELFDRVLLPAIEVSRSENSRWVQIFLRKYFPAWQSIEIHSFPVKPWILSYVLGSCSSELPMSILMLYHQYVLTNMNPRSDIQEINATIRGDAVLRALDEGKHWLWLYGQKTEVSNAILPKILVQQWKPSVLPDDGIRLTHVQDLVVEQAVGILQLEDVNFAQWNAYLEVLSPPPHHRRKYQREAWIENCKPVLRRIVDHVDRIRTPEWQRNPDRKPSVLPDTFSLTLWLLPYPHLSESTDDLTVKTVDFAAKVVNVLREILKQGLRHHEKLRQLETAALRCASDERLKIALEVCNIVHEGNEDDLNEYAVRVELADALLKDVKAGDIHREDHQRELKSIVNRWKGSVDEDIRVRGLRLSIKLDV